MNPGRIGERRSCPSEPPPPAPALPSLVKTVHFSSPPTTHPRTFRRTVDVMKTSLMKNN